MCILQEFIKKQFKEFKGVVQGLLTNHPLFQDGILQDTVSNTTFCKTLIFQGGSTPILCTDQDNNFQYGFFPRKITPRIQDPRQKNTKTS